MRDKYETAIASSRVFENLHCTQIQETQVTLVAMTRLTLD